MASVNYPVNQGASYIDLVLLGLRRWPDRVAIWDATGIELTYVELEQRIWQFAAILRDKGLGPGRGLAQLAANRTDAFVTMIAAMALGARYTPLHPMGSLDDQLYILDDAEISVLVIDTPVFEERGESLAGHVSVTLTLGDAAFGEDLIQLAMAADRFVPETLPASEDVAWVTYTGGTTGTPKGVVQTQSSMAASCLISTAEWEWPEDIRYLASSPISHAAGFLVAPTLLKGGTVYLLPGFDPDKVLDLIESGINTLFLVPTMIYALLDHPRTTDADLSNLELMIYASAPMAPTRLKDALHEFGSVMMQCYGQTENVHLTLMRKSEHDFTRPDRFLSCGRPPAGMQTKVLDEEGKEKPVGEIGEVCARGSAIMAGYWKLPEATDEVFRGGWLHTGDLGKMDEEGFIYLVDRAKDMIISGGFNVDPREVEDVLSDHPSVAHCAVIGVPDEKWGERVLGAVVPRPGENVSEEELIDLVKDRKGVVHAPKEIMIVNELPLTALGKTDKKALRADFWAGHSRMVN